MIFFYILVLSMPLSQHRFWASEVGDLTVFKYLGGLCALYAVLYMAGRRRMPAFLATRQAQALVVLYVIAFFSLIKSGWSGLSPFLSYTSFLLLFFTTVVVIDSLQRLRWVLLCSIGSVAFASLYVIREWQKYHEIYPGLRPGRVVGDPNYFTVTALVCLPLAYTLIFERRPTWERAFCAVCLLITLTGIMLAASRGGFLGLVCALLFLGWQRSRRRLISLALAAVVLLPLALLAPASPISRLINPSHGDTESMEIRQTLWAAGLRMIGEHPIAGVGLGQFKPTVGSYVDLETPMSRVAHNSYVEITAEMGIPGVLAFLGVLVMCYRSLSQTRRRTAALGHHLVHEAALGIQAGLVGFAVGVVFVSGQYQKMFWLMVFVSMCLPALVPAASTPGGDATKSEPDPARVRAVPAEVSVRV